MVTLTHISEGLRMFKRRLRVGRKVFPRYKGNANKICEKIIDKCWNGEYIQTSAGHFNGFYARDFGWCADYLLELGKKEWVKKTLDYALTKYKKTGIKTAITPKGKPFDFPNKYCIDGVAYMFHVLRVLKDKELIEKHKFFLESEIYRFEKEAIDPKTGMVYKDRYYSSMKDCSLRTSSCYDNLMAAWLSEELDNLKTFNNPLKKYRLKEKVKKHFWTGEYFKNDMDRNKTITGDSNIFPFWTKVVEDKKMMKKALESLEEGGLIRPFPLKYVHKPVKEHKMILVEKLAKNWEQDTVWSMMGMIYIDLMSKVNKKKAKGLLKKYKEKIEEYRNFLEVFDKEGKPYKSRFYICDDSMSWACMYLALAKRLKV